MNRLADWKVATRMIFLVVLALVGLLVMSVLAMTRLKETMLEDREAKTMQMVEVGLGIMTHFHDLAKNGQMDDEAAKESAREALRHLRYGQNDYFYVIDTDHRYVLMPSRREIEGQSGVEAQDANGKYLFREIVATAMRGGGFVDYWFPRAGQKNPEPKLAYTALYKPWGWVLGTGIYIDDVDRAFALVAWQLGGVAFVLLVLLGLSGWRLSHGILRQLGGEPHDAAQLMERVASGDLSHHQGSSPSGSLVFALSGMIVALRALVTEIRKGSDALVEHAKSINDASSEVSRAALDQAEATSSMASAIEELTVSSGHIAESAKETERNSMEAMKLATTGQTRVAEASESISQLSSTVELAAERMTALENRANEVSSIASVIKGIAGQTNLLALNAAIEAARAGEQGRGFAVVADEVRKLAERTTSATSEIDMMIQGIHQDTRSAVEAMQAVLPQVETGVSLTSEAQVSLVSIAQGAEQSLARVQEVASATKEQGAASTAIAQRVEQVAQMVENTARTVEGTAKTAQELEMIAQSLQQQIKRFQI